MKNLSAAAFNTIEDIWSAVHVAFEMSPPEVMAAHWLMVSNICSGFSMQHRSAGDDTAADTFEWLHDIAMTHRDYCSNRPPVRKEKPVQLAVVNSLRGITH